MLGRAEYERWRAERVTMKIRAQGVVSEKRRAMREARDVWDDFRSGGKLVQARDLISSLEREKRELQARLQEVSARAQRLEDQLSAFVAEHNKARRKERESMEQYEVSVNN